MTRDDFIVGQTVYLKTISHPFECWKKERIIEGVVTKIGRKYITVKENPFREYRFNIENDFRQETEYAAQYVLYPSKQAIYDYWQSAYLFVEIRKFIEKHGLKLNLRMLKAIASEIGIPLDPPKEQEAKNT